MHEGEGHISTDSYWEIEILYSIDLQYLGKGVFSFTQSQIFFVYFMPLVYSLPLTRHRDL